MEGLLSTLAENLAPIAASAVAAIVAYGVAQLRRLVKATETKLDDAALQGFREGVMSAQETADAAAEKAVKKNKKE